MHITSRNLNLRFLHIGVLSTPNSEDCPSLPTSLPQDRRPWLRAYCFFAIIHLHNVLSKNYQNRTRFDESTENIKWCKFFAEQCTTRRSCHALQLTVPSCSWSYHSEQVHARALYTLPENAIGLCLTCYCGNRRLVTHKCFVCLCCNTN